MEGEGNSTDSKEELGEFWEDIYQVELIYINLVRIVT